MKRVIISILLAITIVAGYPIYSYEHTAASIVMLTPPGVSTTGGTGFELQYGKQQFTVTNAHVCENGIMDAHNPFLNEIQHLKVLSKSPNTDLCLLEPVTTLPSLNLRFRNLKKGDDVKIWGHPLLNPLTVTGGVTIDSGHMVNAQLDYILTKKDADRCNLPKNRIDFNLFFPVCVEHVLSQLVTAKIQPGSSGSPVLDAAGRVAGVAFAFPYSAEGEGSDAEIIPWSSLYLFLVSYTHVAIELE